MGIEHDHVAGLQHQALVVHPIVRLYLVEFGYGAPGRAEIIIRRHREVPEVQEAVEKYFGAVEQFLHVGAGVPRGHSLFQGGDGCTSVLQLILVIGPARQRQKSDAREQRIGKREKVQFCFLEFTGIESRDRLLKSLVSCGGTGADSFSDAPSIRSGISFSG